MNRVLERVLTAAVGVDGIEVKVKRMTNPNYKAKWQYFTFSMKRYAHQHGMDPYSFAQEVVSRLESVDPQIKAEATNEGFINMSHTGSDNDERESENEQVSPHRHMEAIGIAHTCFSEKYGTPRQPAFAPHTRGKIILRPYLDSSSVEGLQEYSHIWVTFLFDRNKTSSKADYKTKVSPPKLNGKKRGVFATRSPHRPNPIGLSMVRLDRIDSIRNGNKTQVVLLISGVDIVDGTQVLDIKPYHPMDCCPDATFAAWVTQPVFLSVDFADRATGQLANLPYSHLEYYSDATSLRLAITEIIRLDPRSVHSQQSASPQMHAFFVDHIAVTFQVLPGPTARVLDLLFVSDPSALRPKLRSQGWLLRARLHQACHDGGQGTGPPAAAGGQAV